MLARRLRRCLNIKLALGECSVFAGTCESAGVCHIAHRDVADVDPCVKKWLTNSRRSHTNVNHGRRI